MRLDAFASERVYARHLDPIWEALPAEIQGDFHLGYAVPGLGPRMKRPPPVKGANRPPLLVAASKDIQAGRAAILVEHGAGQIYVTDNGPGHPAYSGGEGRGQAILFLCPNEKVCERNRAKYPVRCEVVGAPILDRHQPRQVSKVNPLVAIAFHWRCRVAPEAQSAWDHYGEKALRLLKDSGVRLLGHSHPRMKDELFPIYNKLGIETEDDIDQVLERADLLVIDNSSSGFEAMAVGIPVVWLNAPWYRRDVFHGLRFWEFADAGVQCSEPSELLGAIERAIEDSPSQKKMRDNAVRDVYAYRDGKSAERAARVIIETLRNF